MMTEASHDDSMRPVTRTAAGGRRTGAAGLFILLLAAAVCLMSAASSQTPSPGATSSALASGLTAEEAAIVESERFRRLALELRCLVCQNQSLADSNAPLAQDLRNEVIRLIASGRDDNAIKSFLVDRYGEFVLYRPTWSWRNALLWVGPFLLVLIGAVAWWRLSRARPTAADAMPAEPASPAGTAGPARADSAQAALDRVDDLLRR